MKLLSLTLFLSASSVFGVTLEDLIAEVPYEGSWAYENSRNATIVYLLEVDGALFSQIRAQMPGHSNRRRALAVTHPVLGQTVLINRDAEVIEESPV